jgi:hypothetical protein
LTIINLSHRWLENTIVDCWTPLSRKRSLNNVSISICLCTKRNVCDQRWSFYWRFYNLVEDEKMYRRVSQMYCEWSTTRFLNYCSIIWSTMRKYDRWSNRASLSMIREIQLKYSLNNAPRSTPITSDHPWGFSSTVL